MKTVKNTKMIRTAGKNVQGRYEEKKSVFLGDLCHVENEEQAAAFIESIRKKYYDARHHCYAWIIGEEHPVMRSSDDGEPSGTAGRPVLDVLSGEKLTDTVLVVTRYFGGTLLGTGGLVRAYGAAARDCIEKSTIIRKESCARFILNMDYTDLGRVQYYLNSEQIRTGEIRYTDRVSMDVLVPAALAEEFAKKITELSAGRIRPENSGYEMVEIPD